MVGKKRPRDNTDNVSSNGAPAKIQHKKDVPSTSANPPTEPVVIDLVSDSEEAVGDPEEENNDETNFAYSDVVQKFIDSLPASGPYTIANINAIVNKEKYMRTPEEFRKICELTIPDGDPRFNYHKFSKEVVVTARRAIYATLYDDDDSPTEKMFFQNLVYMVDVKSLTLPPDTAEEHLERALCMLRKFGKLPEAENIILKELLLIRKTREDNQKFLDYEGTMDKFKLILNELDEALSLDAARGLFQMANVLPHFCMALQGCWATHVNFCLAGKEEFPDFFEEIENYEEISKFTTNTPLPRVRKSAQLKKKTTETIIPIDSLIASLLADFEDDGIISLPHIGLSMDVLKYMKLPNKAREMWKLVIPKDQKEFEFGGRNFKRESLEIVRRAIYASLCKKEYLNEKEDYKNLVFMIDLKIYDYSVENSMSFLSDALKLLQYVGHIPEAENDILNQIWTIQSKNLTKKDQSENVCERSPLVILEKLKSTTSKKDADDAIWDLQELVLPSVLAAIKGAWILHNNSNTSTDKLPDYFSKITQNPKWIIRDAILIEPSDQFAYLRTHYPRYSRPYESLINDFINSLNKSNKLKMKTIKEFDDFIDKRKLIQLPHGVYEICHRARCDDGYLFEGHYYNKYVVKCAAMAVFSHLYPGKYFTERGFYRMLIYMIFVRREDFEARGSVLNSLQVALQLLKDCGGHKDAERDLCEQMFALWQIKEKDLGTFDDVQEEVRSDLVNKLPTNPEGRNDAVNEHFKHFARNKLPSIVLAYQGHHLIRKNKFLAKIPWTD
ncbi:hypothetical protein GCK72_025681 [Caenorhabditis remanei]|uniref:Uncharacterized protein n=1 Tax=Caenorhabditis remanei TaxID=31234 RepID=A0A6A5G3L7_CAERE|nr:hypothetical protein GCK72_025681 [Caenorhabditis remanei]KAF1749214.1 hypothetical protein GCK72_025681 [Caenorhabditis remanei]